MELEPTVDGQTKTASIGSRPTSQDSRDTSYYTRLPLVMEDVQDVDFLHSARVNVQALPWVMIGGIALSIVAFGMSCFRWLRRTFFWRDAFQFPVSRGSWKRSFRSYLDSGLRRLLRLTSNMGMLTVMLLMAIVLMVMLMAMRLTRTIMETPQESR